MIAIERYDDVTRIRMSSVGSRLAGLDVSAYVVRGVLVDSGFPHVRDEFATALAGQRLSGAIVTHWHEDHAGNVALLAERGIPLQVAPGTLDLLRAHPPIRAYRRLAWGWPPAFTATHESFAHDTLRFIHTPGHSPEHHVVWDAERGTLFSGDLWLGVRARVMHESEDPRTIVESLRCVAALRPERMFDAHRGIVPTPVAALEAKAEWLTHVIGEIERRLAEGWSERAIVREVLGGEERSAWFSGGEYARVNLVRAVRRGASVEGRGSR